ncbi:cell division protein ZipA [Grimontia hollisae]|uniref:Cell division protein ZipA n=2 Tax=Grimontia hollisae TaxID=673 RepID=D0ICE3_GRIHO|nr:cell division protein ZipA [Grimontia hollisae]AMG29937.1 cell division protein ZipA [Grimontia hollisae]EEY71561.1 cell division protein ZipA [Grimontia hollisae CIP 101886]MDF2183459.1 cell division protein ZipA [Grimontia hollisae]STO43025.1 Cell division protein ZipA [Grimontia hollisae]STO56760.1 Cell division protein ZipA [Grimontia hollisae]
MMQELRLVLIILGAVAIAALLLHGLWTSRKEKPAKFGEKPIGKLRKKDDSGFDQDGIGSIRVLKAGSSENPKTERKEPGLHFGEKPDVDPLFAGQDETTAVREKDQEDLPLPTFSAADADVDLEKTPQTVEKPVVDSPDVETGLTKEVAEDAKLLHSELVETVEPIAEEMVEDAPKEPEQQVLIMNVQASNNAEFNGEELINCLEQHGMIFGEMEIFHRHADLAGTGKVLFSAANMFNPGSFPLATIHQFTTPGITFFMTLPCYGEAEQNFKLMLQTAQQVADQLGGLVTDDNRNMMTPQRLDSYREKIKRFHAHA